MTTVRLWKIIVKLVGLINDVARDLSEEKVTKVEAKERIQKHIDNYLQEITE